MLSHPLVTQVLTRCPIYKTDQSIFPDPAKSPQRDSPYYDVVDPVPVSGFEQTHSVIKKHHNKKVEKEGEDKMKDEKYSLSTTLPRVLHVPP